MEKAKPQSALQLEYIGEKLSHYFFGKAFPVQIALLVTLCYLLNQALVALLILSLLASFILIFYKNLAPIIPVLLMAVFPFRGFEAMENVLAFGALMPVVASLIARPFIHPIKFSKPGLLFYPLLLVSLALALGGVLRPENSFIYGLAQFISLGPTMLLIYTLFFYNLPAKNGFCIKKYLCYSLVCAGLTITAELYIFRNVLDKVGVVDVGWGNVNTAAAFLLLSIPACYYLIMKSKVILPLIPCLLLLYVGIILSNSDACLGISIFFTPFLLIYSLTVMRGLNRRIFFYSMALVIIAVVGIITSMLASYNFEQMLTELDVNVSSSGREVIYQEAITLFKENPLFGYGFSYKAQNTEGASLIQYNFHSTLFHAMATMGIFGVIAYGVYVITRFVILMRRCNPFSTAMLTAFIMFESYSMIDGCEINAIPLMCTVTVIITVAELVSKKGNESNALPLCKNNF